MFHNELHQSGNLYRYRRPLTIKCPVCGLEQPETSKFSSCGISLKNCCSQCGAELREEWQYCGECGHKIQE
ncbi:zinc-ribbon domain-containing protein [Syntrophomonas wolfei]|uniref:zinc-ribbon domain-containing protein n=1 Tax=Syntrophomonas wolfei TaxID=863 RepID=UPI0012DED5ED